MIPLADEAGLDPVRLDADYNARATVSTELFTAEMARYRAISMAQRAEWGRHLDVTYDASSGQGLDIFGPAQGGKLRPVFLFIHGGYWRALSKEDSAMMAGMLGAEGIATVAIDYRLAPAVSLAEIVREVRAALAFLWHHGADYGIDRDRIAIGGSSAGGHLVGALLATGWHDQFDLPENVVKFAMPVSGLFELAPLAATFPQDWLKLTPADVQALSPMRHVPVNGCPVTLAWAETDADGFKRQSEAYAGLWQAGGGNATLMQVPGRNHFDVLMDWADPASAISQALLAGIRTHCSTSP